MAKNLKKKTFTGFFWLIVGSSSQIALQILVLSILARLITPEEFGVVSIAIIFLGFSKTFSQLGMGAAIIQKQVITTAHIRTAYTTSLLIGVFFYILMVIFSENIALYFEMPQLAKVLKYISCIFIIDSIISISQSLLQRNMKMKYFALTDLISYLISFGFLGVTLAFMGYGIYALVYAYILQAVLRAIMVFYLEPHSILPFFDRKSFKDLVFFGGGFTLAKIANYSAGEIDKLVVGKMINADALGYYSRAYQLMVAPVRLIGQSLNIVLFPALSSVQTDIERVKNAYYKSTQLVAYASLIISAILVVNAREVVLILLGENWLDVILPFQILASGTIFRMSYKIGDSLVKALGDVYRRAIFQVIYAGCVLLFSYIGQFWGIQGVAIGVSLAIFINFIFMAYLSLSLLKDDWIRFLKLHIKPFLLSILVLGFAYATLFILRFFDLNLFVTEIIYLFMVLGFLIIIFLCFKQQFGVTEEINSVIKIIKNKKQ
ncbi:lipopolysaccharide biosynthesis protein [Formosa maritima]|uniref:Lipopolysaccharide biosynthesis protein n=1 Tax=Formosa maritima TaxID=2592046 RepID=A0A5D0G070_9FLAO|nr:lipopolysaccharide biosynthesis protein [Formosa maritima]TYA52225.1 lipopolysaccharide biosynthesis protein [Formosa maritima]